MSKIQETPSADDLAAVWTLALLALVGTLAYENELEYSSFKEEIQAKSRYIPTEKVAEFFEKVHSELDRATVKLRKGKTLYRARIAEGDLKRELVCSFAEVLFGSYDSTAIDGCDDAAIQSIFETLLGANKLNGIDTSYFFESRKGMQFQGYSAEHSGATPCSHASAGRLNPERITVLYTAETEQTAIQEIKPYIGQTISVAKLKTKKSLSILDLTADFPLLPVGSLEANFKKSLLHVISDEFGKPNQGDPFSYIPTQYLTEYIKEIEKLDGIRFWS